MFIAFSEVLKSGEKHFGPRFLAVEILHKNIRMRGLTRVIVLLTFVIFLLLVVYQDRLCSVLDRMYKQAFTNYSKAHVIFSKFIGKGLY